MAFLKISNGIMAAAVLALSMTAIQGQTVAGAPAAAAKPEAAPLQLNSLDRPGKGRTALDLRLSVCQEGPSQHR